jgi:hypothetical protein
MRWFQTKAEAARYVTRELLPEQGRDSQLTITIRQGKSGELFVTSATTDWSEDTPIPSLSKEQHAT